MTRPRAAHGADAASRPTAVVFDLGGVLIDWDPRYLYRSVFEGDEAAMEAFLAEVTTPEWNLRQDAGRSWSEAIETLTEQFPHHAQRIGAFRDRWIETVRGAIEPTVAVLRELRAAGVPLYALTNWSAETFPLARPQFPFLDWFDGIVVSGEVGMVKPDPGIYRHLVDTHGLSPETTVFIDDSEANVRAATEAGMIGIRFTRAAALRTELIDLGLLDERCEAVLITGVYGSGKSALAANIGDELERRDLPFAALDLDWLAWFNPGAGSETEQSMVLKNLAALVANYRSARISYFVLAHAVADAAELDAYRRTLDMPVRVVRLSVPLEEIERRLTADGRPRDSEVARAWAATGKGEGVEDLVVDNHRPIGEVVREVLDWLGWPPG
jgi:2-haloacid dehalogenase